MKSQKPINKATHPEDLLYQAFSKIKTAEDAKRFLKDLCSPAEIQAMADRWLVVEPLIEGKSYRKIHDETGVSITTIGRIARVLAEEDSGYQLIFSRLK